jgi:hypothetical protein
MKKFFTKKLVIGVILSLGLVTAFGAGAFANSALTQVTAYQNAELKVSVNGKAIDQSSEDGVMYPLVYNGHSYVSAKALAEALGAKVHWNNETQTVEVTASVYGTDPKAGVPYDDNTSPTLDQPSTSAQPGAMPPSKPEQNGDQDKGLRGSAEKFKSNALLFLKVYSKATATGDTTYLDKLIERVASNDADGIEKELHHKIDNARSNNEQKDLEVISKSIDGSDGSNIKIDGVKVDDGSIKLAYSIDKLHIMFTFSKGDGGKIHISKINIF